MNGVRSIRASALLDSIQRCRARCPSTDAVSMSIPIPGSPVRGSQSGAPIMALFDLLGRRWAMGIMWQLSGGPATFRALQTACESISPAVLNSRLKDLREAQLVVHEGEGYRLTDLGRELYQLLEPFGDWSLAWARIISPEHAARWKAGKARRAAPQARTVARKK